MSTNLPLDLLHHRDPELRIAGSKALIQDYHSLPHDTGIEIGKDLWRGSFQPFHTSFFKSGQYVVFLRNTLLKQFQSITLQTSILPACQQCSSTRLSFYQAGNPCSLFRTYPLSPPAYIAAFYGHQQLKIRETHPIFCGAVVDFLKRYSISAEISRFIRASYGVGEVPIVTELDDDTSSESTSSDSPPGPCLWDTIVRHLWMEPEPKYPVQFDKLEAFAEGFPPPAVGEWPQRTYESDIITREPLQQSIWIEHAADVVARYQAARGYSIQKAALSELIEIAHREAQETAMQHAKARSDYYASLRAAGADIPSHDADGYAY